MTLKKHMLGSSLGLTAVWIVNSALMFDEATHHHSLFLSDGWLKSWAIAYALLIGWILWAARRGLAAPDWQTRGKARCLLVIIGYMAGIFAMIVIASRNEGAAWLPALAILPILPGLAGIRLALWALDKCDEFQRKLHQDAIAIAAGILVVVSFAYGFLDLLGLPAISMMWVPVAGLLLYTVTYRILKWRVAR